MQPLHVNSAVFYAGLREISKTRKHREVVVKARCGIPDCSQLVGNGMRVCNPHWKRIPDDIKMRIRIAVEDSNRMEWYAAVQSAAEALDNDG